MEDKTIEGIENLERTGEASDLLGVPEGAKEFVDIIGDENIDSFGNPSSNMDQL